ncbi:MAG: TIGR03086 family metal-binding protein [Acidimicrobiales bacterium]
MAESFVELVPLAARGIEPLFAQITPGNLEDATPCAEFDVGALAAHLIDGLRSFAAVAAGGELALDLDPDLTKEDAAAAFRRARDQLVDAFGPDALARVYPMPWGDTPGRQLLGFELIELTTHGWDLARALGQDGEQAAEAASAALDAARLWVDDSVRVPGMFGPEVTPPPDATPTERLAAFLGRDPAWRR